MAILPEYPCGNGVISAISSLLFLFLPVSSKYIQSSAKYFFHGTWFPVATESNSSCVLRTSSAWVMSGRRVHPENTNSTQHNNNETVLVIANPLCIYTSSLTSRRASDKLTRKNWGS